MLDRMILGIAIFGIVTGSILFVITALAHQSTWYYCLIIIANSYTYWYHSRKMYLDKVFGDIKNRGLLIA